MLGFANGSTSTAELVVGADGVRSQVRPLVTNARPSYSGVSFIEFGIADAAEKHPAVAALVGRGSLFAMEDDQGLIAQCNSSGFIRVYAAFRMPQEGWEDSAKISFASPAATRASILAQFADWASEIRDLIAASGDSFLPRPITAMPVGVTWRSQPNMTLLGDAAHQMSPFAGAGANLAMQDGAELALELRKQSDAAAAIATYEAKMCCRAEAAARESAEGLQMCISADGSRRMADMMKRFQGQGPPP